MTHSQTWIHLGPWLIHMCHCRIIHLTCHVAIVCAMTHSKETSSYWVMAHTNAWHIWMRHVQYEWVLAYINESVMVHTSEPWLSHGTYRGVTAHILRIQKDQQPLSHGTNESVMSSRSAAPASWHKSCNAPAATASWHIWIWHVTRTSRPKRSAAAHCVISHVDGCCHDCRSHGTYAGVMVHVNESWHT